MSLLRLSSLLLSAVVIVVAAGQATPVQAQAANATICPVVPPASINSTITDGDTVRAMVIFVRFRDDTWNGVRSWPLESDSTDLPDWAYGLLAPNPNPATFPDSSLSAYFYEQSRTGSSNPSSSTVTSSPRMTSANRSFM